MFQRSALITLSLLAVACAQQVGKLTAETHPKISWQSCKAGGTCTTTQASIVLDANWRWLHSTSGSTNCYTGNAFNTSVCSDSKACAANCALDGADYSGTYGITTSGNALTLKFVTQGSSKNIGSRTYLLEPGETKYQIFKLLNQEFTFDVDVSKLPCGLNGALYFSEMDADGGLAKYSTNKAGAAYGTGYCDSQCPKDLKFINGEANSAGWTGSASDANSGAGTYGSCCNEMDIWEANSVSAAYTPHPCSVSGQYRCSGSDCVTAEDRDGGVCDPDGCDFNSFRMGDTSFYGPGKTVDTNSKFTVVTQFLTDTGTASGTLIQIRRIYVQNGKVIQNSVTNVPGMDAHDSITEDFCDSQKATFGDTPSFSQHGGLAAMGKAMNNGMVLVLSVWDDHAAQMLWLDAPYPTDADASKPGIARGTCSTTSGAPADVEANAANIQVAFSNIKFGDIGSTFNPAGGTPSQAPTQPPAQPTTRPPTQPAPPPTQPTRPPPTQPAPAPPAQTKYGQCGGQTWTGPKTCAAGSTCQYSNAYYSQCL